MHLQRVTLVVRSYGMTPFVSHDEQTTDTIPFLFALVLGLWSLRPRDYFLDGLARVLPPRARRNDVSSPSVVSFAGGSDLIVVRS